MAQQDAPAPAARGGDSEDEDAPAAGTGLMEDDRFKAMFEDPDFAINEESEEYRLLHPNAGTCVDCCSNRVYTAVHDDGVWGVCVCVCVCFGWSSPMVHVHVVGMRIDIIYVTCT